MARVIPLFPTPGQGSTQAPTEPSTQAPTEPPTQAPTEPSTKAPTEAPAERPTERPTEPPTAPSPEPPTPTPEPRPSSFLTRDWRGREAGFFLAWGDFRRFDPTLHCIGLRQWPWEGELELFHRALRFCGSQTTVLGTVRPGNEGWGDTLRILESTFTGGEGDRLVTAIPTFVISSFPPKWDGLQWDMFGSTRAVREGDWGRELEVLRRHGPEVWHRGGEDEAPLPSAPWDAELWEAWKAKVTEPDFVNRVIVQTAYAWVGSIHAVHRLLPRWHTLEALRDFFVQFRLPLFGTAGQEGVLTTEDVARGLDIPPPPEPHAFEDGRLFRLHDALDFLLDSVRGPEGRSREAQRQGAQIQGAHFPEARFPEARFRGESFCRAPNGFGWFTSDARSDAGKDARPDAGPGAGKDARPDAGPGAGNDAGPDAGKDAVDGGVEFRVDPVEQTTTDGFRVVEEARVTAWAGWLHGLSDGELAELNRLAAVAGFVRDAEDGGRIVLASKVGIFEGDARAAEYLYAPILVPWAAVADWTLERLGRGETRVDPHDVPFEDADAPPPVAPEDWTLALRTTIEAHGLVGSVAPGALTAHFPWDDTGRTARLHVTSDHRHPLFGRGLRATLEIPVFVPPDEAAGLAAELNAWELETPELPPCFGAWVPGEAGPMFLTFVPNALCAPGIVSNLATWARVRTGEVRGWWGCGQGGRVPRSCVRTPVAVGRGRRGRALDPQIGICPSLLSNLATRRPR